MPWGRLDDNAAGNGKLLALSDAAFRMWTMGLIYCQRNLTDGFIPGHAIRTFGVRAHAGRTSEELCRPQLLDRSSLWEKVDDGYRVHDYLQWNDSREQVLERRTQARGRTRRWRSQSTTLGDASQPESQESSRDAFTVVRGSIEEKREEQLAAEQLVRFEAFWALYPNKERRKSAWEQWVLIAPDEGVTARIVASVKRHLAAKQWRTAIEKGDLHFVPLAKNFLANGQWDDVLPVKITAVVRGCPHLPRCTDPIACTHLKLAAYRPLAAELRVDGDGRLGDQVVNPSLKVQTS